jgi:hypothetical protein
MVKINSKMLFAYSLVKGALSYICCVERIMGGRIEWLMTWQPATIITGMKIDEGFESISKVKR